MSDPTLSSSGLGVRGSTTMVWCCPRFHRDRRAVWRSRATRSDQDRNDERTRARRGEQSRAFMDSGTGRLTLTECPLRICLSSGRVCVQVWADERDGGEQSVRSCEFGIRARTQSDSGSRTSTRSQSSRTRLSSQRFLRAASGRGMPPLEVQPRLDISSC